MAGTSSAKNKNSPNKGKGGTSPKPSPSRGRNISGRRNLQEVKDAKPRTPAWYLCGGLVDGNLAFFTVTQSDPGQDAFTQKLIEEIADSNSTAPVVDLGILGAFYMKVSLTDERPLTNVKDEYMRKAFIILMEEDEMTKEGLFAKLQVVKAFLELPKANKFKTKVIIPKDWDVTPPEPAPLMKLDHFLQYKEILSVLKRIYNVVDMTWYANNQDWVDCYFTQDHIPFEAVLDLGFPEEKVLPAAPHITNDPVE